MKLLEVSIKNKIATGSDAGIVCGNSNYMIKFKFDAEWDSYNRKTARFIYNDTYVDRIFEGDSVEVPILHNTRNLQVGVFAGELQTTTPARFPCYKSILCDEGLPEAPPDNPSAYEQLLGEMDKFEKIAENIANTPPSIVGDNGNWYIWSPMDNEYIDSGHSSTGFSPIIQYVETSNGYVLNIVDSEGSKSIEILHGKDGEQGPQGLPGKDGDKGDPGKDGISPTLAVKKIDGGYELIIKDVNGEKSITLMDGKDGAPGVDGKDGSNGLDGEDGVGIKQITINDSGELVILLTDNTQLNLGVVKGPNGEDGKDGVSATHVWDGTILTITSASGTSSADLKGDTGEQGKQGEKGDPGYTPQKGVDYFTPKDIEALGIDKKANKGTTLSEYGITDAVQVITINGELDLDTAFDDYIGSGLYVFKVIDNTGYSSLAYTLHVSSYSNNNEVYQTLTDFYGAVKHRCFFVSTDKKPYPWTDFDGVMSLNFKLNNKADKATTLAGYGIKNAYTKTESDSKYDKKVDKTTIITVDESSYNFEFSNLCNTDVRAKTMESISFNFSTDEYSNLYEAGLCFDSGETPTRIDYVIPEDPEIIQVINWVGVDCVNTSYVNSEGQTIPISVFEPSPNKHYEVSFLYNGTQFIGWVSGFILASGNVVSES